MLAVVSIRLTLVTIRLMVVVFCCLLAVVSIRLMIVVFVVVVTFMGNFHSVSHLQLRVRVRACVTNSVYTHVRIGVRIKPRRA